MSVKTPEIGPAATQVFVSVKCSGSWDLYLVSDDGDVDWARLSVTSGSGDRSSVLLKCDENTSTAARKLSVVIDAGSKWAECIVVQAGKGGNGNELTYSFTEKELKKVEWLELPALDDPNLGYYGHGFYMNGKKYRNYSFGWSQKDRVSLWVAYPLCKTYTNGSAGRVEDWALDPLLGNLSAAPFTGYAGSYARGHQLPSADRQCCDEANAQTFYGTNIQPQLNAHNSGIWAELEGDVRSYANTSDTTYVVTGVIISATSKKEKDSYGQSVTIPDAYFKAVLRYHEKSSFGKVWCAAAFYLEHRSYSGGMQKSYSMSIDQLEKKTGIDFFVNLPAKLGSAKAAEIEAEDPADNSIWW